MPEPVSGDSRRAELLLNSTLASVDEAEMAVLERARAAGFDEDQQHELGIAVRETMVNAIAHGNRYSLKKKVRLQVWLTGNALEIEIDDEGNGFDLDEVPDPREGDNVLRHSGRGLLMVRAFVDELEIKRREPRGTHVRMVKYVR